MKKANKVIDYSVYGKIAEVLKKITDTSDVQLPSVEYLTDTIKGAGIMGEIEWPSYGQIASMALTVNFGIVGVDAVALAAPGLKEFEIRWVIDVFDTNDIKIGVQAHKAYIKCVPKKHDTGKLEPASTMDGSNEYEVIYYRRIIDGVETLLIDKFNSIFKVNGTDYMSAIMAAL